jgi:flagellar hook-associated protein FlgK
MNEQEVDVFKQVGPIVKDVNELLKRVKRLNQQVDTSQGKYLNKNIFLLDVFK